MDFSGKPKKLVTRKIMISTSAGRMRLIILRPQNQTNPLPGILWIHGGGYTTGMAGMVRFSAAKQLAELFGAVVISPEYRLAGKAPYPAALEDCFAALRYMADAADELMIRRNQIIVGGESAGGGLAVALCLYARDHGGPHIAFQLPLYPMLDCEDTPSSANNHAFPWDTFKNHISWKRYLRGLYGSGRVPKYASPARETDYSGLPPAYTFVCEGEPFRDETLTYIQNLQEAGVQASVDVYSGSFHCFDMLLPWTKKARDARQKLCEVFGKALEEGFRP